MEEEDEEDSPEEPEIAEIEEEDLEKALSVERFSNILTYSGATGADRMGRHYTEKDFECRKKFSCFLVTWRQTMCVYLYDD